MRASASHKETPAAERSIATSVLFAIILVVGGGEDKEAKLPKMGPGWSPPPPRLVREQPSAGQGTCCMRSGGAPGSLRFPSGRGCAGAARGRLQAPRGGGGGRGSSPQHFPRCHADPG
ncbi:peptide chain release factor I [Platysternon megacephalum]|uniref:Peptide chain release factor I n=1 Tax=Platysternon megacephalum TaxID=55544 RepID=A0A4D9DBD9_9SAUR|nr:peptide chain release factor I [Platysternon megacephalum]